MEGWPFCFIPFLFLFRIGKEKEENKWMARDEINDGIFYIGSVIYINAHKIDSINFGKV